MDYKDLELQPLDEEQIKEMGLSEADLWMIKFENGNVHGPFDTKSLIESSQYHEDEFDQIEIFNLIIEKWAPFYKTTQFQRRKPKLVPAQNLTKAEAFHVLIMGQSFGPYTLDELKAMTEDKKIRLNSEISTDAGKTWIKMYEHYEFDRRLMKSQDELPFVPAPIIIEASEEKLALVEEINFDKDDSSEIMAGLAFVGRGNDEGHRIKYHRKSKIKDSEEERHEGHHQTIITEPERKFFQTKRFVQACASFVIVAFLSVTYFNYHKTSNGIDTSYSQASKVPAKQINNSHRNIKKRRVPASVTKKEVSKPLKARKRSSFSPKIKTTKTRRIIHTHQRPEDINLDDPSVRDQIAREIASEEYLDEEEEYNEDDVVEHYEGDMPMQEPTQLDLQVNEQMPRDEVPMDSEEDYREDDY